MRQSITNNSTPFWQTRWFSRGQVWGSLHHCITACSVCCFSGNVGDFGFIKSCQVVGFRQLMAQRSRDLPITFNYSTDQFSPSHMDV